MLQGEARGQLKLSRLHLILSLLSYDKMVVFIPIEERLPQVPA